MTFFKLIYLFLVHIFAFLAAHKSRFEFSRDVEAIKMANIKKRFLPIINSKPFSVIFISDMEAEYRGHNSEWCLKIVEYITNLGNQEFTYDDIYSSVKIIPELVIHGGDISDGVHGSWAKHGDSASNTLFSSIWQKLYDSKIPMISAMGNHDFSETYSNSIRKQAKKFVSDSYSKSKDLVGVDFKYVEIPSKKDKDKQSLYVSTYGGYQFVNLNNYSPQDTDLAFLTEVSESLDETKKTLFFGHYPLSFLPNQVRTNMINIISRYPNTAYFSGHVHVKENDTYSVSTNRFVDYVAPYPHPWEEPPGSGKYLTPGMYAVLLDPAIGVLQVKFLPIDYENITGCWVDGTICGIGTTCKYCCHENRNSGGTQCGGSKWADGTLCLPGITCEYCLNKFSFWSEMVFTACGKSSTYSCISGDMLIETKEKGIIPVREIQQGNIIPGSINGTSTWCTVVGNYYHGKGTLNGNFTSNHIVLEGGRLSIQGIEKDQYQGDLYNIVTDCEFVTNSDGKSFTPFSTDGLDGHCLDGMSIHEYHIFFRGFLKVFEEIEFEPFNRNSYIGNYKVKLNPMCVEYKKCLFENQCAVFQLVVVDFIENNISEEVKKSFRGDITEKILGRFSPFLGKNEVGML
jgi:hypothetical protein